jgi:hypothetical protein
LIEKTKTGGKTDRANQAKTSLILGIKLCCINLAFAGVLKID